ncbi:hypothetical protein AVEN_93402-1 [Araneus ventricosus]|uniref:Uncharacterized protein n=1 Tax=Araneus ventricosus TaxID=182803 RepID=A0A4Y2AQY0_ARAVE|nr:hypothetical protein AVEN_93402-1 [Araneus ventricosus]
MTDTQQKYLWHKLNGRSLNLRPISNILYLDTLSPLEVCRWSSGPPCMHGENLSTQESLPRCSLTLEDGRRNETKIDGNELKPRLRLRAVTCSPLTAKIPAFAVAVFVRRSGYRETSSRDR